MSIVNRSTLAYNVKSCGMIFGFEDVFKVENLLDPYNICIAKDTIRAEPLNIEIPKYDILYDPFPKSNVLFGTNFPCPFDLECEPTSIYLKRNIINYGIYHCFKVICVYMKNKISKKMYHKCLKAGYRFAYIRVNSLLFGFPYKKQYIFAVLYKDNNFNIRLPYMGSMGSMGSMDSMDSMYKEKWDEIDPYKDGVPNTKHSTEKRRLTLYECASLAGWKNDILPIGDNKIEQINKSLPYKISQWLARQIALYLSDYWRDESFESKYSTITNKIEVKRFIGNNTPKAKCFDLLHYKGIKK